MALLGAQMTEVEPGMTEIVLPFREELTQQHGFVHAGVTTSSLPLPIPPVGMPR